MLIELWPVDRPIPYARNPRRNQAAVDRVARSLVEFGFRQPIVVDADGIVVVGHTRLAAAKAAGLDVVPVHVAAEMTPAEAKAYRIADNRIPEGASWDFVSLGDELRRLQEKGLDLSMTAIPSYEIEVLLQAKGKSAAGERQPSQGDHRVVFAADQFEVVQRAADALDPPAKDIAAALVMICEAYADAG